MFYNYSNDLYKIIIDSNHVSRLRDCVKKHGRDCVFLLHIHFMHVHIRHRTRGILESHVHGQEMY